MKVWTFALLSALVVAGCGNNAGENNGTSGNQAGSENQGDAAAKQKVTVVLDWTPNTNHTGLYVAEEQGYYDEAGLDVEIIQPGDAGAASMVAAGRADFGISYQEEITMARTSKDPLPIVSIAAVIQHNTSGFAAPAEKGIVSPKDFEGKTYGGWGSPVEEQVMDSIMQMEQADVSKVKIVDIGNSDFFTATKRDIDFAWIFYAWTGIEAQLRGEDIHMIYVKDYSEKLDYYTPTIITNEALIDENPELIKAFMEATSKGYQFAIEQPEQAADILIAAVPDLDPELVKASQEWLVDQYQADAPRWGEQKQEVWQGYADWMMEHGLLEQELDVDAAYTNEFLPEA
ncbi:ABC transporter substrate-binding protein [Marinicrinis lubricantis]|uniref:ABC transporter substrate-binding protein n=1 Tax=Marinicrinis lubricantis TaxID=2086470 RepID=A0ABW1IUW2_9BACL